MKRTGHVGDEGVGEEEEEEGEGDKSQAREHRQQTRKNEARVKVHGGRHNYPYYNCCYYCYAW
jgi:hypothetical protein